MHVAINYVNFPIVATLSYDTNKQRYSSYQNKMWSWIYTYRVEAQKGSVLNFLRN